LDTSKENTSFGESAKPEDLSVGANKQNCSTADRLHDLDAIVAPGEKFQARMRQHGIEALEE